MKTIKSVARQALSAVGLLRSANPSVRGYLDAASMLKEARREGVDVNDYIERKMQWPEFQSQAGGFADFLVAEGALGPATQSVVEIGPGSGRHLRAIIQRFPHVKYTAYEPDPGWRAHLARAYGAEAPEAGGESLAATPDASADLLHAHAVMVYVPFLTAAAYFNEAARVVRPGGFFAFNAHTEETFSEEAIVKWLARTYRYPAILPRQHVLQLMEHRGFRLVAENRVLEGDSLYFLFCKDGRGARP